MTLLFTAACCFCFALSVLLALRTGNSGRAQTDGFYFFEEDDSDIKIAGAETTQNADDESLRAANELDYQRGCGNLVKGKELGTALSQELINEDGESSFGADVSEDAETRAQRRQLLAFAVVSSVETGIKSAVRQGVVLNVFYNTLRAALPEFYDDINESASFSFYTLCARRGGDVAEGVGHTFAMLVGREKDAVTEELGKALYLRFVDITQKTISAYKIKQ